MGSGGSKKLDVGPTERRRSHVDTNPPPQSETLVECAHCGRTFAEDRVARHEEVCEKMQERKRDIYNIAEKRGGTLMVDDENENKQKFDWKQTRTDLLEQLKEAKKSRPRSAVDPPIEMFGVKLDEED